MVGNVLSFINVLQIYSSSTDIYVYRVVHRCVLYRSQCYILFYKDITLF